MFVITLHYCDTDTYLHPLLQYDNLKETTYFNLLKLCQRPDHFLEYVYCRASFRRSVLSIGSTELECCSTLLHELLVTSMFSLIEIILCICVENRREIFIAF